ncbi:MAG: hypothetical protein QW717_01615 [Candidatus Bathyarchaeia archaeon]
MSVNLEIPLTELKEWLELETSSTLTPVHAKVETLLNKMRETHTGLVEACRMLLESSRKEIEKRNMRTFKRAQALNKLAKLFLERMQQIKVPEKPSFKEVNEFVDVAGKSYAVTDFDLRNWFPKISPFFIMDRGKFQRTFENAKGSFKELNDFLTKEYVKIKTLEETFQLIDEVKGLKEQLETLKDYGKKAEVEKAKLEEELINAHNRMAELKSGGELAELVRINEQIEVLKNEVEHTLRHLQKPLVKLQLLALHGEGSSLNPDELAKLSEYLADPFEALATEKADYPLLKGILQKTLKLISDGKLKLKQDKERKAKQAVDEILAKDSLANLYRRCVDARLRKTQLLASSTISETKSEVERLQEHVDKLKKKLEIVESEIATIEKNVKEMVEKIGNSKNRMEKNVFEFSGRKITIIV